MKSFAVDLASPLFKADPYPFFARLREEAPVARVGPPGGKAAWIVTRYDDVLASLRDERFVKDRSNALTADQAARQPWVPSIFRPLTRNMLDLDGADHTRLRALVQKAFTPRLVGEMKERIERLTHELLDSVSGAGRMDLIRDYALPLPTTVIAEMLGIPPHERRRFHRWSSVIVASEPTGWRMLRALPSVIAFLRYIRRLLRLRRAHPAEDLVSALVQAEESGDQLDEDELLAMIFLLLVAGHETTVNLIGNGALALLRYPDAREDLDRSPEIGGSAIEELLRYESPLQVATERWAREDVTIAGTTIPRGEMVYVALASANRDERQFSDPERLILRRDPNRHLAFGHGIHFCLGAPLARLEGRIAITTLVRRARDLRLTIPSGKLRWKRGIVLRGLQELPVAFTPGG